jgi:hypothetical protein
MRRYGMELRHGDNLARWRAGAIGSTGEPTVMAYVVTAMVAIAAVRAVAAST